MANNWLLKKISNFLDPKHSIVLEEVKKSRQNNEELRNLIKQFRAHIDREDVWFTCECSDKKPKESVNASPRTLCYNTPYHNGA